MERLSGAEMLIRSLEEEGVEFVMRTKVHNPYYSRKRKCDELIPMFEYEGALEHRRLGEASCLLIDAKKMFDLMVAKYKEFGVTMYTPQGSRS